MKIFVTWLFAVMMYKSALQASPVPLDIKKVVVFIYAFDNATNAVPDGTGFLVGVPNVNETNKVFIYLVTAKHVLRPATNFWLPGVVVRLNLRDGTSKPISLPLSTNGQDRNVFLHDDPTVDIAVVRFGLNRLLDQLALPISFIPSESDFDNFDIREGSDVFFCGMFVRALGTKHNTPITRFGKIALIPDEKLDWLTGKTDLYLIEANSYPGNSGSPVFFQVGAERKSGIFIGSSIVRLGGVMSGCYNDIQPVQMVSVSTNQYVTPNLGIAGVVPSYKVRDILLSKELRHQRGE